MNEIPTRLNLIQRAMQRGAVARDSVGANDRLLKQSNDRATIAEQARVTPLVRLEPELEQNIGEAEPVHLDYVKLRTSRIATPDDKTSATYNEFRSLKRKLLSLARSSAADHIERNVVMVTSALPREGKTFTVMNLAICLAAEHNLNVILVDGDVIRGSVGQYFDGEERSGLIELLTGKCRRIEDVLHPCADLQGLHVLFAGKHDNTSPELLSSPRMDDICGNLSKRFENCLVLFDTPPVLASSESAALAAHAHHLIMLIAAGQAARNQVEAALAEISACSSINLLFNRSPEWQRPLSGPSYYYGQGVDETKTA